MSKLIASEETEPGDPVYFDGKPYRDESGQLVQRVKPILTEDEARRRKERRDIRASLPPDPR